MKRRADTKLGIGNAATSQFQYAGSNYVVKANNNAIYVFFNQLASNGIFYTKSTDNGISWEYPVQVISTASASACVWYDRWSGLSNDLIHIAYLDFTNNDIRYKNLDASSDTLSSEYVIFNGASAVAGAGFSITRTIGGNIICGGTIDAGAELFCYKSTDVGVNWSSIAAVAEANNDQIILTPDPDSADNQDCFAFFWDSSANEISVKRYDDSADSWGETLIASSMICTTASTSYPHWAAAHDITNQQILLVAWSAVDTANADLRCWKVKNGSITETAANVILNSADDQGFASIGIDTTTNYWYVFYAGKSDGSETIGTAVNIYYKVSQDGGDTWGAETKLSYTTYNVKSLIGMPRFTQPFVVSWFNDAAVDELRASSQIIQPSTTYQLGM